MVVQDNLYDTELDINFYNYGSDTNTGFPRSIILNVNEMSTAIGDYNTKTSNRFRNRKEHIPINVSIKTRFIVMVL